MTTEFLAETAGLLDTYYECNTPRTNNATDIKIDNYSLSYLKATTKFSEKKLHPSGDYFKGYIDKVTGMLIYGIRLSFKSGVEYGGDGILYYEGWFYYGLRHGYDSTCIYENGAKFVGYFRDDRPYEGTLFTSNYTYTGYFCSYSTSATTSHPYYLPIFNGYGTLIRNETIYEGEFYNGKYHGMGKLKSFNDGNIYIGHFEQGQRHGVVALYTPETKSSIIQMWYKDQVIDDDMLFMRKKKIEKYYNDNISSEVACYKNKRRILKMVQNLHDTVDVSSNINDSKLIHLMCPYDFFYDCWNHLLALERKFR